MIVPQGPIVGLPFEALVESGAGGFLVERWVVSYAPNATMALDALTRAPPAIKRVTAILDVDIDDFTQESKGIEAVPGLQLNTLHSSDVLPDKLGESLTGAEGRASAAARRVRRHRATAVKLTETSRRSPPLPAAALLSLPLRGMKLVVLSACKSGTLQVRNLERDLWVPLGSARRRRRECRDLTLARRRCQQRQMDADILRLDRKRLLACPGRRRRHARNAQREWQSSLFLGGNAGERSLMAGLTPTS